MKKGLISVLGTVLLAMAGSGFANAPIITGVPDVVIGDADDAIGATADANFFRYADAFNIMDYVTDADATSTPDVLKFAFDEVGTNNTTDGGDVNNISINDVTQVNATDLPGTWGANAIQGTYLFSFRDILRSPGTGTPATAFPAPTLADGVTPAGAGDLLPWSTGATTVGSDNRQVTILVADETDNVDDDTINVYSMNDSADKLSGTFTTVFSDSVFAAADWTYQTFAGYSAATSGGGLGGGFIGLSAGATAPSVAYVGRWYQNAVDTLGFEKPIAAVGSDLIYRAKMTLGLSGSATKSVAPTIRFGVENALQMMVITNSIGSATFGEAEPSASELQTHIPAVGSSLDYNMYWAPTADLPQAAALADYDHDADAGTAGLVLDGWGVFFDVVDTEATDSGEWRMTYLEVDTMDRPATDPTAVPITDFTTGWETPVLGGTGASVTPGATSVVFTGPIPGATAAYALFDKANVAAWEVGKILRISAKMSTPTTTARDNLHAIRIRSLTQAAMIAQEFAVIRRGGFGASINGALTPDVGVQTAYETYVGMYGGAAALLVTNNLNNFNVALDELPGGTPASTAATSWTCHEVLFEVLDDPLP